MNSDSDPPFPPLMSTAEMLNSFDTDLSGSMQPTDAFFDTAPSTDSSNRLLSDDMLSNSLFPTLEPAELQAMQNQADTAHTRQTLSTSPESSLQDSASDSSGHRKRKSSSRSSHSGVSVVDSPMASALPPETWSSKPATIKRESTSKSRLGGAPNLENHACNSRAGRDFMDFGSAESSPNCDMSANLASYSGLRHVAIQYQDSPMSTASFMLNTSTNTRETSPTSNSANLNQPARLSPFGGQEENLDSALLKDMQQRSWPFGNDVQHALPSQPEVGRQQAYPEPLPGTIYQSPNGILPNLIVHPTPQKSRVETQIPIKLSLFPLPQGVTKLHLPSYTISKPKLLVRPPPEPSPETLELHTMLVCTSAMQDPMKLRRALAKAAHPSLRQSEEKRRLSAGAKLDKDDEEQPLNGGEVRICEGCIIRERKRAARKKSKKPDEEEMWQRDEARRVVVFNTNEVKEWQPAQTSNPTDSHQDAARFRRDGQRNDFPEGTMQVDIPMRIACYCRHQNEKLGFQVILTIKDYQGRLVAQRITDNILITDDHKTHPHPGPMQPSGGLFEDHAQMFGNPMFPQNPLQPHGSGLSRNAHSTTDLQNLPHNFNPQFLSQTMIPYAIPSDASQTASISMTPRNLSRQASPSAPCGPVQKKRKASGGINRVPNHLTMTRLQTESTAPEQQWAGPVSASSGVPSPYTPIFPPGAGHPPQPQAQHFPQRSGNFVGPPQAPLGADLGMLTQANRSQSFENFNTMPQMYSAPPSTRPSRAPSPSGGLQMASAVNPAFGVTNYHAVLPQSSLGQQRPPTIHKLIPSEGPKAGGIEVTCLGSGFYQGLEVVFGEALATTTTYWGETSLVCLLPPAVHAGIVPVTFKHQFQQPQSQFGRYPSPPLGKSHALFRYVDDDEQEIMRQALLIVSQKMRGDVNDAAQVARWIVGSTGTSQGWSGNSASGNQRQGANVQSYLAGATDCEDSVLRCLELVDLDESPFPANLSLQRQNGQTILHLAASLGYHRLVAGLLARGADPDSRDNNGMSPMHMAALNGHAQIVRRLRVSGADSTTRSLSGYTPADMAISSRVLDAVETLSLPRSRSADSKSMEFPRERRLNLCGTLSIYSTPAGHAFGSDDASDDGEGNEDSDDSGDSNDLPSVSAPQWTQSRRNSTTVAPDLATAGIENGHSYMFAVAAMSAWRDQITAQLQQFQQSVNFTFPNLPTLPPLPNLPPMPNLANLPDYQTHPMVRRFSSFVPHRNSRPSSSAGGDVEAKEGDSKWWDFLTGSSSPPAYEEIYPAGAQEGLDSKIESAARAAADAAADLKCSTVYDTRGAVGESSKARTPKTPVNDENNARLAQRKNVKRLRSDSKLFLIWIPLLVLVIAAMLKDRLPELVRTSQNIFSTLSDHYRGGSTTVY